MSILIKFRGLRRVYLQLVRDLDLDDNPEPLEAVNNYLSNFDSYDEDLLEDENVLQLFEEVMKAFEKLALPTHYIGLPFFFITEDELEISPAKQGDHPKQPEGPNNLMENTIASHLSKHVELYDTRELKHSLDMAYLESEWELSCLPLLINVNGPGAPAQYLCVLGSDLIFELPKKPNVNDMVNEFHRNHHIMQQILQAMNFDPSQVKFEFLGVGKNTVGMF